MPPHLLTHFTHPLSSGLLQTLSDMWGNGADHTQSWPRAVFTGRACRCRSSKQAQFLHCPSHLGLCVGIRGGCCVPCILKGVLGPLSLGCEAFELHNWGKYPSLPWPDCGLVSKFPVQAMRCGSPWSLALISLLGFHGWERPGSFRHSQGLRL